VRVREVCGVIRRAHVTSCSVSLRSVPPRASMSMIGCQVPVACRAKKLLTRCVIPRLPHWVSDSERIEVTLVLRRRTEIPDELVEGPETITREELAARYGADPADIGMVKRSAEQHGLTVTQTDPASRRVKISGTLGQLRSVVQADSLTMVTTPDPADEARTVEHRQRTGELRILPEWDGVVIGVTGLDNRPQARPHIQRMKAHAAQTSYSPVDSAGSTASPRVRTAVVTRSASSNSAAGSRRATWTPASPRWASPCRAWTSSRWATAVTARVTRPTGK
jgi:hypothetical protein